MVDHARFPYRDTDYAVRVVQEPTTDGLVVYSAWHPELPGCESQGDTEAEARVNLRDAFQMYVGDLLARDLPVPAPDTAPQVHDVTAYIVNIPSSVMVGTGLVVGGAVQYGEPVGSEGTNLDLASSRLVSARR